MTLLREGKETDMKSTKTVARLLDCSAVGRRVLLDPKFDICHFLRQRLGPMLIPHSCLLSDPQRTRSPNLVISLHKLYWFDILPLPHCANYEKYAKLQY